MAASGSIMCDICGGSHDAECCPELGLGESFMEQEVSRARRSLPNNFCVIEYPDQAMDVVAKAVIPSKMKFGPFEAKESTRSEPESDSIFYLKVFHKDGSSVMLDATCEDDCNWLCLVRVAQSSSEQNCIAYQMGKSIFYSSTKQIEIDEVLRVWYAPYYAQKMEKPSEPDGATKSMLQAVMENVALVNVSVVEQIVLSEDEPAGMLQAVMENVALVNVSVVEQIVLSEGEPAAVPQTLSGSMETNAAGGLIIHLDSNNPDSGSSMYTALDMVELGADNKKEVYDNGAQAEICSAELSLLNGSSSEIITSHDSMSNKCSKCDSVFDDQKDLAVHLCEHISSDMVKYSGIVCSDCGQVFKNRMLLDKHVKPKHKGVHKCAKCDFVTTRDGFLTSHMRSHSGICSSKNIDVVFENISGKKLEMVSRENNPPDKSIEDVACEDSTRIIDEDPASSTNQVTEADSGAISKNIEQNRWSGLKRKSSVSVCEKVSEITAPGTKVSVKRCRLDDADNAKRSYAQNGENDLKNQPTIERDLNTKLQEMSRKSRSGAVKKSSPVTSEGTSLKAVADGLLKPLMSPSRHLPVRSNRGNRLKEVLNAAQIGCRTRTIKKEPLSPVADEMKEISFDEKTADAESQNLFSVPLKQGSPRKGSEKNAITLISEISLTSRPKVIKEKDKSIKISLTPDRADKHRDDSNEEISKQDAEEPTDKSSESLERSMRKSRGVNKKYNSEYVIATKNCSNLAADNDDDDNDDDANDDDDENNDADDDKDDADDNNDDDDNDDDDDENGEDSADEMQDSVVAYSKDKAVRKSVVNLDIADITKDESGNYIFLCKICSKSFSSHADLNVHYALHTEKYHCQICDKTYSHRGSILNHRCDGIVTCQGDAGFPFMYECVECDEIFNDGKLAKVHTLTHVGRYWCSSCSKSFRRQYKLDAHVCISRVKEEKITDQASAFVCEICGTVFDRLSTLSRHMTKHTEIYKCNACNKTFPRKDSWQRHILRCSPEQAEKEGVHSCPNCAKGFTTLLGKDNHVLHCNASNKLCKFCLKPLPDNLEVSDDCEELCSCPPTTSKDRLRFKCSLCTRAFMSEKSLERHVADHADAFVCPRCTKAFCRKDDCEWHALQCGVKEKIKESGFVECIKCNTQYTTAVAYRDHCHTHTHPFQCEVCQKRFRRQASVRFHACRVKSEKITCEVCGRSFQHDRVLEVHMHTHGTPTYSCEICQRKFHQERFVRDHKCRFIEEAVGDKTPSHICDTCGKGFSTRGNLHKHMILHTDQRPMCDLCNKPFHSKSYLKEHIASVHENRYDYTCTYCDKVFKLRTGLQAHTKQFHDPTTRLYECELCGKTFRQRSHLAHHMFSHSGARDFTCSYCSRAFRYPDQLARHQLEHTVKERLKCDVCEKTFIKGYRLRRHIEQAHSGMAYICSICDTRCSFKHTLIRHFHRKHPSAAFRMENPAYVNSLLKPSSRPGIPTENVIIKTVKLNTPYQQFPGSLVVNSPAIASNSSVHKGTRVSYTGAQPNFYSILQTIDGNRLVNASTDIDADDVSTLPCTSDDTIQEMETVVVTLNRDRSMARSVPSAHVAEETLVNANVTAAEALHKLSHSADIQHQTERQVTNMVQLEDGTILDLDNLPADITTADGSHVIIMQIAADDGTEVMHVEDVAEQTVIE